MMLWSFFVPTKRLARLRCIAQVAILLPVLANAAISVDRTRLIVTEQEREASPQILNEGTQPVLIQAWVDTGEAQTEVKHIQTPFIVDPPVFRLEPGQSRHLRVLMVQPAQSLPRDRESVFWFNVLEIPPKPHTSGSMNHLQVSFQTRLKIFFRPEPIAKRVRSESDDLRFALRRKGDKTVSLSIQNPSPLHQTINTLAITLQKGKKIALKSVMIDPGQAVDIPLNHRIDGMAGAIHWRVHFSTIDDFGVVHEQEKDILLE